MFNTDRIQLIYFTDKTAKAQYYTKTIMVTSKFVERFLNHNRYPHNIHSYVRYLLKDIPGSIKRKEWNDKRAVLWGIPINASIIVTYYPIEFHSVKYLQVSVWIYETQQAIIEEMICL